MLSNNVFYHGIIRKHIVVFGSLFSNLFVDRKLDDSVSGTLVQRLQVPIAYGPKEKWVVRTEQDPTLENHTQTTYPLMAFEITNYSYDSTRKLAKMNPIVCNDGESSKYLLAPSPWNIDIQLYVLTNNQEDGMQILEQILPTFAPEYTLRIKTIPSMHIVHDVPLVLNGVTVQDDYDSGFDGPRMVIHTLSFQLKTYLYGPITTSKPIYTVYANISTNEDFSDPSAQFTAVGDPETYEITSEAWVEGL